MSTQPERVGSPSSRLRARPRPDARLALPGGWTPLGLGSARDGLLYVPPDAATRASPLVVVLHGAGSSAGAATALLDGLADEHGLVLLAPDSRGSTWDVIRSDFGPDVAFLDRALERVFTRCPIDTRRVALAGFSDGASYALSLGVANGDLFTHVIAFSPGFAAPPAAIGRPRLFVSHGIHDPVLPIDRCSRRLVPGLRASRYDTTYEEFDGGHSVPVELAQRSIAWLEVPRPR